MKADLITKIKQAKLVGRGGASFSVAIKWQAVKEALDKKRYQSFYLVINAAEGEPGVKKDRYILESQPQLFLEGVLATVNFFSLKKTAKIYCFIGKDFARPVIKKINNLLSTPTFNSLKNIWVWEIKPKTLSYISGEETTILNIIEDSRVEPRLKPPMPVFAGLFQEPTLVNNVETFYNIALVSKGKFENKRFYTINGKLARPGVYHLPANWKIEDVLKLTGNWPPYKFFVQVGGDVCGEFLNSRQLGQLVSGSGSITVYPWFTKKEEIIGGLLKFFKENSCGKCAPCREGTYRLLELAQHKKLYSPEFWDIVNLLKEASFCAYGKSIFLPLASYYQNILQSK